MYMNSKNLSFKNINYISLSFKIGILFLVSAPAISTIFLIFSSIGGFILQKGTILKDKFNIFLFFISLLILSVTIYQTLFGEIPYESWTNSISFKILSSYIN